MDVVVVQRSGDHVIVGQSDWTWLVCSWKCVQSPLVLPGMDGIIVAQSQMFRHLQTLSVCFVRTHTHLLSASFIEAGIWIHFNNWHRFKIILFS